LRYWLVHPISEIRPYGKIENIVLNEERLSLLTLIACCITAGMGTGTVIAVFLTARRIFHSDWAAGAAGASMACIHEFVFYCHTGNVDVPSAFWFAWALYGAILVIQTQKWRHFIALSIFAALSVTTKDPSIGFAAGLALFILFAFFQKARAEGKTIVRCLISTFSLQCLAAGILFLLIFVWFNNIATDYNGYVQRMNYWKGPDITSWSMPTSPKTYALLPFLMMKDLYVALGWPLSATALLSAGYFLLRNRTIGLFCLFPLLSFFLIVVVTIRFSAPRFYMPGFTCLAILAGGGISLWLQHRSLAWWQRYVPVGILFCLTFFYALGISLEMRQDTRKLAVRWFQDHVKHDVAVGALFKPTYAPNLRAAGFSRYRNPWIPPDASQAASFSDFPDYVITGWEHHSPPNTIDFYNKLHTGMLPYTQAVCFQQNRFYPRITLFGLAGAPVLRNRQVSPPVIIWKKSSKQLPPNAAPPSSL